MTMPTASMRQRMPGIFDGNTKGQTASILPTRTHRTERMTSQSGHGTQLICREHPKKHGKTVARYQTIVVTVA